jgi:hypothetical protein
MVFRRVTASDKQIIEVFVVYSMEEFGKYLRSN